MVSRVLKAAVLLLVSAGLCAAATAAEGSAPRDLSFLGRFAAEHNKNKFEGNRLDCVYGDPIKGRMCPPVMVDPMAHLKEQPEPASPASSSSSLSNSSIGDTVDEVAGGLYRWLVNAGNSLTKEKNSTDKEAASVKEEESSLSIFSRCLDDPDTPECRGLQVGNVSPSTLVASAPGHGRNLIATTSPTIDDWYVGTHCMRKLENVHLQRFVEDDSPVLTDLFSFERLSLQWW